MRKHGYKSICIALMFIPFLFGAGCFSQRSQQSKRNDKAMKTLNKSSTRQLSMNQKQSAPDAQPSTVEVGADGGVIITLNGEASLDLKNKNSDAEKIETESSEQTKIIEAAKKLPLLIYLGAFAAIAGGVYLCMKGLSRYGIPLIVSAILALAVFVTFNIYPIVAAIIVLVVLAGGTVWLIRHAPKTHAAHADRDTARAAVAIDAKILEGLSDSARSEFKAAKAALLGHKSGDAYKAHAAEIGKV